MRKLRIAVALTAALAMLLVGATQSRAEEGDSLPLDLNRLTDLYSPRQLSRLARSGRGL